MHGKKLPEGMAEVAGSLEEAAGYEKLALERRKGTLGLVSAFLMAGLLLAKVIGISLDVTTPSGVILFAFLLAYTFGLRPLLRKRPGWEPLFEQPRGKLFWKRYAIVVVGLVLLAFGGGVLVFQPGFPENLRAAFPLALFGIMGIAFQWLMPRAMPGRYSLMMPLVAAGLLAFGLVPATAMLEALFASMAIGLLVESSIRLFAPRRWLVR